MEIRHDRPIEEDIPCPGRRNQRLEDDGGAKKGENSENSEDTQGSRRA
jgi:hypothetical protein